MKRGDVVVIATGKPRPAVVVQTDSVPTPYDVLLCPFTTHLLDAPIYRLQIEPDANNGLRIASQIMVDKVGPVPRDRIGKIIGRLSQADLTRLATALLVVLDLVGKPGTGAS